MGDVWWYQNKNSRIQGQEQEVEYLLIIYNLPFPPSAFQVFSNQNTVFDWFRLNFAYLTSFEKKIITDLQVSCSSPVPRQYILIKGKPLLAVRFEVGEDVDVVFISRTF